MPTLQLVGRIALDAMQWKSGLESLEKGIKPYADRMSQTLATAFSKNPIFGGVSALAGGLGLGAVFDFIEEKASGMQERLLRGLRGTAMTGLDAEVYEKLANVFEAAGS